MNLSIRPSFRQLIRENIIFFSGFLLYLITCAILLNIIDQGEEIFYFSDHRSLTGDSFFLFATKLGATAAFLVGLGILLCYRYRSALYLPLLGATVSLVSYLTKTYFAHQRPSLYFRNLGIYEQINIVEGIHINGGTNSFPSGHTMAAFALFAYLALCLPQKRWLGPLFILLAALVALSRIYLVQHFLKDVYLGAVLGILIALAYYYLQLRSPKGQRWDRGMVWNRE